MRSYPCRVIAVNVRRAPVGLCGFDAGARSVATGLLGSQLTAFFTNPPILASSAAVNSYSAKAVGHMAPSSRFASCMKPRLLSQDSI
jgi:hypothetical protein